MVIWIDNDACPRRMREIIFKAATRLKLPVKIVANSYMHPPPGMDVEIICVSGAFDAADNRIVEGVTQGDLVITADIPLADRVIQKGAAALNSRGQFYTPENIKDILSARNLNQELRSAGEIVGGPKALDNNDVGKFAAALDRFLTKAR